jgi:glycosyltransferase involved in cell wall biosynthesis
LKLFFLLLAGLGIAWQFHADKRLPWTVLWALASVFLSRVYWLTAIGTLRLEQLACLVLFSHFLIDLRRRRAWPRFGLLPWLLFFMLPLMLLGSFWGSPLPMASLKKTLIYFPYMGGFAALCYFLDNREKLAAAWDFLVRFGAGMVAISLAGYFLFLAGVDLGMVRVEIGVIWLRGSLVNPNIFGAAAGLVLVALLARFLASPVIPRRRSIADIGALCMASAALVVSFSRAAWILTAMALIALFFLSRRERIHWVPALSALMLSVTLTIAITVVGSKAYWNRMNLDPHPAERNHSVPTMKSEGEFGEATLDRFSNSAAASLVPTKTPFRQRLRYNSASIRWRFTISLRALRDWMKSPLIGRGTDSLRLMHPNIPQYYIPVAGVAILHDWGIGALAIYVLFLLITGFLLWKKRLFPAEKPGLFLAVFLSFLLTALLNQTATTLQLASFWVLAAIFAVAAHLPAAPGNPGSSRPLRIGYDAKWFFSDTSSCRVMVRNMLKELIAQKGEMELFIFLRRRDRRRDFPFHGPGIHLVYVAGRPNLLANLTIVPWIARRLALDVGIFQYFAPPFCSCRRIVVIHDIIFAEHREYFSLAERLYFRPMKWLARRAQFIATISHAEKARLVRHGYGKAENIAVLHPGVNNDFKPREEISCERQEKVRSLYGLPPRFLLYLGRINVRKNLSVLFNALALIKDHSIPLVLAGKNGGKREAIDAEIRYLRLEERIIRPGFVSDQHLPVLMALSTLFCYVSHDEGFGLPVLEAMACGAAVVVSRKEVLQEICGPAGNYVDPKSSEDIAAVIDRLLAGEQLRGEKRAMGLLRARSFSWGKSAADLLRICGAGVSG